MDFLKKIASRETRAAGGGNFIRQGRGRLMILKNELDKKKGGLTWVTEFKVVHSEDIPGAVDREGKPEKANAIGSTCSYVQQLEKFDSAPGNVKALVLAIGDDKEDEISEAELEANINTLIAKNQPARGMLLDYETYQKEIRGGKNAGQPITLVRWKHVPGQTEESLAANRASLDQQEQK